MGPKSYVLRGLGQNPGNLLEAAPPAHRPASGASASAPRARAPSAWPRSRFGSASARPLPVQKGAATCERGWGVGGWLVGAWGGEGPGGGEGVPSGGVGGAGAARWGMPG